MNSVARYLAAQAAPLPIAPLTQPNVFERTLYAVAEIEDVWVKAIGEIARLKAARASGNAIQMQEAARGLQKMFGQGAQLCEIVSRAVSA